MRIVPPAATGSIPARRLLYRPRSPLKPRRAASARSLSFAPTRPGRSPATSAPLPCAPSVAFRFPWNGSAAAHFHSSAAAARKEVKPFLLADVGEGITECEVVKWNVEEGAHVQEFDELCEVQSDKASVEITSRFTGKVLSIKYKVGEIARVGSPLCEIEVEAEEAEPERVPEPSASKASGEGTSLPSQAAQGAPGGTSSTAGSADLSGFTSSGRQNGAWPPPGASATQDSKRTPVFATPAVRRVAREHDLDLSLIQGTGKDARITKDDVLRHLEAVKAGGASASASTSRVADKADSASHGLWDGSSAQGHEESLPQNVPLDAMRRAMYRAMSSTLSVPHFGYADEIDVTELENLRVLLSSNIPTRYRKAQPPTSSVHSAPEEEGAVPEDARFDRLTLLPFLLKALSHAMLEPSHALFRSTLVHPPTSPPSHGSGAPISSPPSSAPAAQPHLSRRANCDISIALSTPSGLLTPTLPRVNLTSIYDLSSRIVQLSTRARSKGLNRTEMGNGGTITLSNVGAVGGGTYTHPLIPPTGQLAIGALGRARWLPRFESELPNNVQARATDGNAHTQNDKVVRRLVLNASFTADHRVVEGAELAKLVQRWKELVERPGLMLGFAR